MSPLLPTQTEAAVLVEAGRPLELRRLGLPALQPGQVLVEVAYSGVCGSQLLEARGRRGPDRFVPHTLGHEGSGTVLSVGTGVDKVRPGDPVVLSWIKGLGAEVPSAVYGSDAGPVNSGAISTFMRHTVISENRLTLVPQGLSMRHAALFGCALPTGAGIVLNALEARAGQSLAVFGTGGIGLSAILGASRLGLAPIIGIDVAEAKLEQARLLGATHTLHGEREDPLAGIWRITGGVGVDFAIEAAGRPQTMELAFRSVRDRGGLCVVAGNLPFGQRMSLDPMDLIRGKRILGTWGGGSQPDRDLPRLARILQGDEGLERLITHTYPLGEVNRALEDLESGRVGRALLEIRPDPGTAPRSPHP